MSLSAKSYQPLAPTTPDLRICRVLNGLWQVSGAHGRIEPEAAIRQMLVYHDAGFTTWDLADHYGPAEDFIGAFRRRLANERGAVALANSQAFTKWVPQPGPMTQAVVTEAINRSLRRMDVERLDLLQFHWWEYGDDRYLEALHHLDELRRAGKIRYLALTNFDTEHLERIVNDGIPVVSNQVPYSLVDSRPAVRMADYCAERGISLLAYGTVCGGLLSDRYIGQREPGRASLTTASLSKYKQMIDLWGGWELFQELLVALHQIGRKHGVGVTTVAERAILDRLAVAGIIVGARLGVAEHLADTARVFDIQLDDEDRQRISAVTGRATDLYQRIGDCGDEYRR